MVYHLSFFVVVVVIDLSDFDSVRKLNELDMEESNSEVNKIQMDSEDLASTLSHDDLLEITQSSLATLMSTDSLLKDLPNDIIIEEVLSQVNHINTVAFYCWTSLPIIRAAG